MTDKPVQNVVDMLDVVEVPTTLEERLEIAAMVTRGLEAKIRLGTDIIESYKETVRDRDAVLAAMQRSMNAWAQRLARAGEYDHKGKNEVLLRVIADLLATAARNFSEQFPVGDDIPF